MNSKEQAVRRLKSRLPPNIDLISYCGSTKKSLFKCQEGHKFELVPRAKKFVCPECQYIDLVKNINQKLSKCGFKFLEVFTKRGDYHKYIRYLDNNKIECVQELRSFEKGIIPGKRRPKYSVQDITKLLEENGYKLISHPKGLIYYRTKFLIGCPKGHLYKTTVNYFKSGRRCPECVDYQCRPNPNVQEILAKEGYKLRAPYRNARIPLLLTCPEGHHCEISWNKWSSCYVRCPECNINAPEIDIVNFFKDNYIGEIKIHDRSILKTKELDIYLPDKKLAVEYCGLYWHSEAKVERVYHQNKFLECQRLGIQLITIFEDEWLYRREQLYSRLLGILGVGKKIHGRLTTAKILKWQDAAEFLDKYHLRGRGNQGTVTGLYYKDELVMVMTFGKHHRQNVSRDQHILTRLCIKKDYHIRGGVEKLFNFSVQKLRFKEIITYADLRYSFGHVYFRLGFEKDGEIPPDYSYIRGKHRYSKQSLRLKPDERNTGKTEHELRLKQGFHRIYDCGKIRFKWKAS